MSLFTSVKSFISGMSPFRSKATPTSKLTISTPTGRPKSSKPAASGLLTPSTTGQSTKRKRNDESSSSDFHLAPSGLLTPSSDDHETTDPLDVPRHKRVKRVPETPVYQSIEHDPDRRTRLPTSGATKPTAFHADQVTLSNWKQDYNDRLADVEKFRRRGWRESDIALFSKISLRGFEPLLPPHWQVDFNNLPDALFTRNADQASIKSLGVKERLANEFRATKYLWSVIDLGAQVRDDLMLGQRPERRLARTFRHFLDWSLDDADLKGKRGVLPLAVVCAAPSYVSAQTLQMGLNRRLRKLSHAWKRNLKHGHKDRLPPLYGIAVSRSVWAIVSYVPGGKSQSLEAQEDPDNFSTLMNTFDFSRSGQEVWVAFAFAIFAIHCRNELLGVLDRGLVPTYDGEPWPASNDPDE